MSLAVQWDGSTPPSEDYKPWFLSPQVLTWYGDAKRGDHQRYTDIPPPRKAARRQTATKDG